jgi:hypothetical protein
VWWTSREAWKALDASWLLALAAGSPLAEGDKQMVEVGASLLWELIALFFAAKSIRWLLKFALLCCNKWRAMARQRFLDRFQTQQPAHPASLLAVAAAGSAADAVPVPEVVVQLDGLLNIFHKLVAPLEV